LLLDDLVQVCERCLRLDIKQGMHVLSAADDAQFGDRFVRADHELHSRPHAVHETLAALWVTCPAGAEDGPPLVKGDFALQAERGGAGPAPDHGCLTSGCVIVEGIANRVVAAL
jgi:hypothetical protein